MPHTQQGHLQGSLNAINSIASGIGPLSFEYLFYYTINDDYTDGSDNAKYDFEVRWHPALSAITYHTLR